MMALVSVVGSTGCFEDQVMQGSDDTTGEDSTRENTGSGVTSRASSEESSASASSGPMPDGSRGDPSGSTTVMLDGGSETGGSGEGSSDESSGTESSAGETTGEPATSVEDLSPGDLVVTEVMANPHCSQDYCEWFEVYNATDFTVNLLGLVIQDGAYSSAFEGQVTVDVFVEPGGLAILARSLESWPYEFDPDFVYGPEPGLTNSSPERVVLLNSTEMLDETGLFYDLEQGSAWSLSSTAIDVEANDDPDSWCYAVTVMPAGFYDELGSPGVPNPPC